MADRQLPRGRLLRVTPWLVAGILLATSMLVARSFARPEASGGPGPSRPVASAAMTAYTGPALLGVFTGCNPACDLEVATEGIGRRLTFTDRAIDESAPSISPDGTRVAYRCAEPAVEPGGGESPRAAGLGAICLVNLIGNEQEATPPPTAILLSDPGVDYGAPAWSPDGALIAVDVRAADGSIRIGLVDPGTGDLEMVTTEVGDVSNPAWSADGMLLGFICGADPEAEGAESTRFCMLPRDGGTVTPLGSVGGTCGTPAFMPDGVHMGTVCVVPGAAGADLFMLSIDEPFTHSFTVSQLIAPKGIRVAFDPDQRFAFVRREDALWAIGIPEGTWSLPPLPPLHGDFDVRVLAE